MKQTPRYHKISQASSVDESLFGGPSPRLSDSTSTRRIVSAPLPSNAVVISKDELERLKGAATIKTEAQLQIERENMLREKEFKEKKSRDRKSKMIELEQTAKKNAKKSDEELAKESRDKAIRDMAEEKLIDETDLVKMLSTLGARAAAFTIRDRQIHEKKQREETEREYDRRLDMMMEVDRIKDLQKRSSEENYKRNKRFEDRQVIIEQISDRERMKLLAAESREQENIAMRSLIEKYSEDDKVLAARKQQEIERSRLEVIETNKKTILKKKEMAQREEEEMQEILRYQLERDNELRRREQEELRKEHLKKEQQAKLLANQEKNQNKQAELDELRARRAAEQHERKIRETEKENKIKKREELKELTVARIKQAEDKKRRETREKELDEIEIEGSRRHAREMAEREERERIERAQRSEEHRQQIQRQIESNESLRSKERMKKYEEGSAIRAKFIQDQAKLEAIRGKMVADLENQGVNPAYLAEMKNVDIKKILNR